MPAEETITSRRRNKPARRSTPAGLGALSLLLVVVSLMAFATACGQEDPTATPAAHGHRGPGSHSHHTAGT